MSLLLASGHPDARDYPVWLVFEEAGRVIRRQDRQIGAIALVVQAALSTQPNMAASPNFIRRAGASFQRMTKTLFGG